MKNRVLISLTMCGLLASGTVGCSTPDEEPPAASCSYVMPSETVGRPTAKERRLEILAEPTIGMDGTSARICVPGMGYYAIDGDMLSALFPRSKANVLNWTPAGPPAEGLGALLVELQTGASGLNTGTTEYSLVGIDLESMTEVSRTSVGRPKNPQMSISDSATAVLQGPGDRLTAYDLRNGRKLWTQENVNLRSPSGTTAPGSPENQILTYEELYDAAPGKSGGECMKYSMVDVDTGDEVWNADALTAELSLDCQSSDASFSVGAAYIKVGTRSAAKLDPAVQTATLHRDSRTGVVTSVPEREARHAEFIDRAPDSTLSALAYDRAADVALTKRMVTVYDRAENRTVYASSAPATEASIATVLSIYDKKLYVELGGVTIEIDPMTGNEIRRGLLKYPVGEVNGYVVYDDGSTESK